MYDQTRTHAVKNPERMAVEYVPTWHRYVENHEVYEAVMRAFNEIPEKDQRAVQRAADSITIKGLGRHGVMELLARLGGYLKAVEDSRG